MATASDTAQTPITVEETIAQATPWTVTGGYTPASGSDRLVVVGLGWGASVDIVVTGVTLGGQAMTEVSSIYEGVWPGISVWILKEAGIAAMSGTALVATITNTATQAGAIAFTLTGVNQATPTSSAQTGSGQTTTVQPGTAVTSTSNGLVIAVTCTDAEGGFSAQSGSNDSGELTSSAIQSDVLVAAQYEAGTGGAVTPTWTQASERYAVVAFSADAAAAAPPALVESHIGLARPFNMAVGRR